MNSTSDKLNIQLRLGNELFPITVKREEEIHFRNAAKLINSKLDRYKATFPDQGNEKYMFMTLLDITVNFIKKEDKNDTEPYNNSLKLLTEEINKALKK